jgi:hypothetical protein
MLERPWQVAVVLALVLMGSAPATQRAAPVVPEGCRDGELVVSRGSGRFVCAELHDLLGTRRCSSGDLVMVGAFGDLECVAPSKVDLGGARLPECPGGETLVSEGSGRWRCGGR